MVYTFSQQVSSVTLKSLGLGRVLQVVVDKTGQNIHRGKEHGPGSLVKYLGAKREANKVITVRPEGPFLCTPRPVQ